jgi:hypothetical protein
LTPSFLGAFGCFFEAVGFAVDCDDLGVVDKGTSNNDDFLVGSNAGAARTVIFALNLP